jgi:hypothetical protein
VGTGKVAANPARVIGRQHRLEKICERQRRRPVQVELTAEEIESLIESLDCLKTKIAFTKGLTSGEKTERIIQAEALEMKLSKGKASETSTG